MRWAASEGAKDCTGAAEPGTKALLAWMTENSPEGRSMGIFNCRRVVGGKATSLHGEGRALDWGMPMVNGRGTPAGRALVHRLGANGAALGLQCIIYDRTIWSAKSPDGRPYTGAAPHFDHLHIEMTRHAARVMTLATFRSVLGGGGGDNGGGQQQHSDFPGELLKKGSRGDAVRRVQAKLNIGADGIFGAQTEAAVRAFQSSKGLAADGVVGRQTWAALAP